MKNKKEFVKEIKKEIDAVNIAIDRKIAKGKPYIQEAKKHEKLLSLLETYA